MKLPSYLTTVTPLSKTLALILFVFLPIFGFLLGMKYQQILSYTQTSSLITKEEVVQNPIINKNNSVTKSSNLVFMEKNIDNVSVTAFAPTEDMQKIINRSFTSPLFVIEAKTNNKVVGRMFSIIGLNGFQYSSNDQGNPVINLFDIVDNEILVVDQITNRIDVFNFPIENFKKGISDPESFLYKYSINLPENSHGVVWTIKCKNNLCEITTFINPENSCVMDLNPYTKVFSDVKCSSGPKSGS